MKRLILAIAGRNRVQDPRTLREIEPTVWDVLFQLALAVLITRLLFAMIGCAGPQPVGS